VLALDSDTLPGLAISLGAEVPDEPPLNSAVERNEKKRWCFIHGVGPVRAVQRYATDAPDGVRLLQLGKTGREGQAPYMAAANALYLIVHALNGAEAFRDWVILGDLPAGPRQAAYDWAPYAQRFLLVVEPTSQSMLTARRIKRIALESRPDVGVSLVVNKATTDDDGQRVSAFLDLPVLATVPSDESVRAAERAGVAVLDYAPDSPAVQAIQQLAQQLQAGRPARRRPRSVGGGVVQTVGPARTGG
jgi:MinD-like ATPase involved in chromosome partitioning or flagellar assembly